jgi:RNA polymerase sigma-70 factor (ECF subfamily)
MAAMEVPHAGRARDTTQDLYAQYGRQIYSYCLHKLRSREEAEDAVQTTFLNAFRSLQRGAQTQFEQAWLYKIAQNVCVARQTSSSRRLRLETPNDFEVLQEVVPAREAEQPLELFGIEEALERMPENQRRAILLREWQGLSYREISDTLDLSQAAVEMLIFRARRALAGALEQPEEQGRRKRAAARPVAVAAAAAR